MFKRHAAFKIAAIGRRGPWQAIACGTASAHANDNLQGFRRSSEPRRTRSPKLVCRWILTNGNRLESRWEIESDGRTGPEDDDHWNDGARHLARWSVTNVGRDRHHRVRPYQITAGNCRRLLK